MLSYRNKFKTYIDSLASRKPSPGGGSAVSLVFVLGVSLVEKAVCYSLKHSPATALERNKNKKLSTKIKEFQKLRNKIYPYIDKDSYLFQKIMLSRGKRRTTLIQQSEKLIVTTALASRKVFLLAKGVESDIKKGILSDFKIGLSLARNALEGCIFNLEANKIMFGSRGKHINNLKIFLGKWR